MNAAEPPPVEPAEAQRWRAPRWAQRALFEGLLIVFSVVLALTVTSWADDRRTAGRVEEMRGFLRAELQANRALIGAPDHLPHHTRLRDAFAPLSRPDRNLTAAEARPALDQLFERGIRPAQLQDAVWASLSGGELLEHMQPEEVFALARVYRAQTQLEELNRRGYDSAIGLLDLMTSGERAGPRVMQMGAFLQDLTFQERILLGLYDAALAELDDKPRGKG